VEWLNTQKVVPSTAEKETIVPVRFSKDELRRIDEATKRLGAKSRSAFIREAAEKYVQEVGGLKVIEIRQNVTLKDARSEILAYLKEHKEAETFDIANDLRLDLGLAVKVLKNLWEEGKLS
jgi:metal-responsive CopG/Arc/MetJ family transcriptional regulator